MPLLRLCIRASLMALLNLIALPFYGLMTGVTGRTHWGLQRIWIALMCRLLGLRVVVDGIPSQVRPTLFVCNHVSYLDIIALNGLIDTLFVAKHEVAGWPILGWLAKARRTVFIDRAKMRKSPEYCREMTARLREHNLLFFPEGTSTNGVSVRPFKSTFFCVAMDENRQVAPVQPIAITYLRDLRGEPLDGARVDHYAWYGDMTLGPHLLEVMKRPGVEAHVRFMDPIPPGAINDRKQLAAHANAQVAEAVRQSWALAGVHKPVGRLP